ncbi:MAG: flavodoxin family protein [Thermotogota bacterium]
MKVIGIVGSKRKKGNTATLMNEALKAINKQGIETEIIFLDDYEIKGCNGCEKCKKTFKCVIQDGMQKLYPKILKADGLILGSPTYFYNISSDMKAFIERLYCYEIFDESDRSVWVGIMEAMGGKLAATIAVCEQKDEKAMGFTSKAMELSLNSLGYRVVDNLKALTLYEVDAAEKSEKELKNAQNLGEKLTKTLLLKEKIKRNFSN